MLNVIEIAERQSMEESERIGCVASQITMFSILMIYFSSTQVNTPKWTILRLNTLNNDSDTMRKIDKGTTTT